MAAGRLTRIPWNWCLLVILLVVSINGQVGSDNDASRMALIESLLVRGVAYTNDSPFFTTVDMVYDHGRFYSDKPPWLSLYSTLTLWPFLPWLSWNTVWPYVLTVLLSSGAALILSCVALSRLWAFLGIRQKLTMWLLPAVLFGTPVVAFWGTYNSHVLEAALVLLLFYALVRYHHYSSIRWAIISGLIAALIWFLHPLTGTVVITATSLFFGLHRSQNTLTFIAMVLVMLMMGFGIHQLVYGRILPFYFQPELYLYGPTATISLPPSFWLDHPLQPGLTEEKIVHRLQSLGMSPAAIAPTVVAFQAYQRDIENPFIFALKHWREYDFYTLNPLVLFCLGLLIWQIFTKPDQERLVLLWLLLMTIGMYAATIVLRAVPGSSFGNRHLFAVLPAVIASGSWTITSLHRLRLFQLLFWISLALSLPGIVIPWMTPSHQYLKIAHLLILAIDSGLVVMIFWRRGRQTIYNTLAWLAHHSLASAVIIVFLITGLAYLYSYATFHSRLFLTLSCLVYAGGLAFYRWMTKLKVRA